MKALLDGFDGRYEICSETQTVYDLVKNRFVGIYINTETKGTRYKKIHLSINGKHKLFRLHRLLAETFIPNPENKIFIDHKNMDSLCNDLSNLRWVTISENSRNAKKGKNQSSQYKGVTWHKKAKKWTAQISLNNKSKYLGCFKDEIEAARAYDTVAKENGYLHYNFKD